MKKIERYRQVFSGDIINLKTNKPEFLLSYCIVDEKALTKQEAYIEQLEREKEEAVDALTWYCSSCPEMEDSKWTNNLYFKYQSLIKKLTGETWQELKEERG